MFFVSVYSQSFSFCLFMFPVFIFSWLYISSSYLFTSLYFSCVPFLHAPCLSTWFYLITCVRLFIGSSCVLVCSHLFTCSGLSICSYVPVCLIMCSNLSIHIFLYQIVYCLFLFSDVHVQLQFYLFIFIFSCLHVSSLDLYISSSCVLLFFCSSLSTCSHLSMCSSLFTCLLIIFAFYFPFSCVNLWFLSH